MSRYNPIKEGAKGGVAVFVGLLVLLALVVLTPIVIVAGGRVAHDVRRSAPAPVVLTSAPTVSAPAPAPQPVSCPLGFVASAWGDHCDDTRHLPCPAGYTGWQNSQLDNCLSKPD